MEVDGISVEAAEAIQAASVVSGHISLVTGHLILVTAGGAEIDAGLVIQDPIDLSLITLTGTKAEFDEALSDGDFATLEGNEIIKNKDLSDPSNVFAGQFRAPSVAFITASGDWNKPVGSLSHRVRIVGGGGAGGGALATAAGESAAGAGGASGAAGEQWFASADLTDIVACTIGLGGAGVAGASGNAGSVTSFGAYMSAPGGPGGGAMTASGLTNINPPSSQPVAATAQLTNGGMPGEGCIRVSATQIRSGTGGSSPLGAGAKGIADTSANGITAPGRGGGGGGAVNLASQAARPGGNGTGGLIIVESFFA